MVAVLAHALAVIQRDILKQNGPAPDKCATAALFHDASEILTGDLPTPIKYYNPKIRDAYKQVEAISCEKLSGMLPEALRKVYEPLLLEDDALVKKYVKAADKLSAHIKCIEEIKAGNKEFTEAAKQTLESLMDSAKDMPALKYFIDNFLGSFMLSLDQIN